MVRRVIAWPVDVFLRSRRRLSLSGLNVDLSALEVRFIKRSEGRNSTLLGHKANEAETKRHAFTVFTERNLDINDLSVLAE